MSDIAKWALLVVGAVALIGLIVALPFVKFIDVGQLASAVNNIVTIAGDAFRFGRGLVNLFLLPFGRKIVTGLMIWLIGKRVIPLAIKIGAWVRHYIFK